MKKSNDQPPEPTSGDVGDRLQSVFSLYAVDGVTLPFETAPRHSQLRSEAAAAIRTLRRVGFTRAATLALLAGLRTEVARDRIVSTWPTVGPDRKALRKLATTAIKLRQQLLELSPKAAMYLHSGAGALYPDDWDELPDDLLADLLRLANSAHEAVRTFVPPQDRKGHHANVVEAVARVARPLGMKVSAAPTSHFWRACAAAFTLAAVTSESKGRLHRPSPGGSIRALLESEDHPRRGKFWHLK